MPDVSFVHHAPVDRSCRRQPSVSHPSTRTFCGSAGRVHEHRHAHRHGRTHGREPRHRTCDVASEERAEVATMVATNTPRSSGGP
eukprot:scaffold1509_cov353-Pavlova_lutheri.AAC.2